jgi:hypothetical protein
MPIRLSILELVGRVLMATKFDDRLSRSVVDFAVLVERSRKRKWGLGALDSASTPHDHVGLYSSTLRISHSPDPCARSYNSTDAVDETTHSTRRRSMLTDGSRLAAL